MSPDDGGGGARVGVLGGTFNPPHVGHLCLAQEAHATLGLDRVLLVPVGEAPHRVVEGDPGRAARMALTRLAVADDERLGASSIEVDRAGPSYMADTLAILREASPAIEPTLVLGADQALRLPTWHDPERVLAQARLAVAERGGVGREEVVAALEGLPGAESVTAFALPRVDVSSTLVRERVAAGLPIRYLVPDAVAERIAEQGLYAGSGAVTKIGEPR